MVQCTFLTPVPPSLCSYCILVKIKISWCPSTGCRSRIERADNQPLEPLAANVTTDTDAHIVFTFKAYALCLLYNTLYLVGFLEMFI